MKNAEIKLETLTCPSCLAKVDKAVKSVKGVNKKSVDVLFNSSKVKFEFNEEITEVEEVVKAINKVGYQVLESAIK